MQARKNFILALIPGLIIASALLVYFFNAIRFGNYLLPLDILAEYDPVFRVEGLQAYNNLSSDIVLQFFPYRALNDYFTPFVFWNPYAAGGTPFFEDIQARSLEVSNVVATIINIPLAHFFLFSAISLLLFAGVSMYGFVRTLGRSRPAAMFAGMAFTFASPVILWINYSLGTTFVWLPFLFFTLEKILQQKAAYLPIFSFAVCMLLFAGHPQAALITLLFCAAYVSYAFFGTRRIRFRQTAVVFIFLILGVGLSAVQTLPAFDFIRQSEVYEVGRGAGVGSLARSVRGQVRDLGASVGLFGKRLQDRTMLLVLPWYFGNPVQRDYHYPENPQGNNYFETTAYLGLLTLVLAAGACIFRWGKAVQFWLFAAAISFVVFADLPFFNLLAALPVLNKINLGRLNFVFVFSVAMLSAFGFDAMWQLAKKKIPWRMAASLLTVVAVGVLYADQYLNFSFLVSRSRFSPDDFAHHELVNFLHRDPDYRYIAIGRQGLGLQTPLVPNQSMVYQLKDLRGYFVMLPKNFSLLASRYLSRKRNYFFADDIFSRNFLNIYGVKYIVCEKEICSRFVDKFPVVKESGDVQVLLNRTALPLAYVSYSIKNYTTSNEVFRALEDEQFDVAAASLVGLPDRQSAVKIDPAFVRYEKNKIVVAADAHEEGVLVVADNYYPGWTAEVNGKRKDIVPVFGSLKGVSVGPGHNDVVFRYRPRLMTTAIIISLVSLVSLGYVSVKRRSLRYIFYT